MAAGRRKADPSTTPVELRATSPVGMQVREEEFAGNMVVRRAKEWAE
jgi:hypothetical protein